MAPFLSVIFQVSGLCRTDISVDIPEQIIIKTYPRPVNRTKAFCRVNKSFDLSHMKISFFHCVIGKLRIRQSLLNALVCRKSCQQHLCMCRKSCTLKCMTSSITICLAKECKFGNYIRSWQVLAITSSCCSRVRSMNLTAYPDTRIVKFAYSGFSGCSIASISFSVPNTFTFRWCAP